MIPGKRGSGSPTVATLELKSTDYPLSPYNRLYRISATEEGNVNLRVDRLSLDPHLQVTEEVRA
jgi:hypothetical protein